MLEIIKWNLLQGILINGQFPGPQIESVTNDNVIVTVVNSLDEPFLISWLVSDTFLVFFFVYFLEFLCCSFC